MTNFQSWGLPQSLVDSLERVEFITPTPIQQQAIPAALEGRDILGSAQTGTGKTGAFCIPLVARLLSVPQSSALILTPTRELAVQVIEALRSLLGKNSNVKTALLIGGESMPKQLQQLKTRPRVIVGTPGRINDHLSRGSLRLKETDFLVLDEIDRMLDMGFSIQLEKIIQHLPQERQTLMFSATMPSNIIAMSQKYLRDPLRIAVGSLNTPITKIKQEMIQVVEADKYTQLLSQLDKREGSILIFVKTKIGAEKLADRLRRQNHSADAIHGNLRQSKRDRVITDFRNCKFRIMVATDIAARGLDIRHIKIVINYDLPQCAEDYIHRVGRTARAGAEGSAISLITHADGAKLRAINNLLHPGESSKMRPDPAAPKRNARPGGGRPFYGKSQRQETPRRRTARAA